MFWLTKVNPYKLVLYTVWHARRDCLAALAFDVTPLAPFMSCGQLVNKVQGSALGSLAPNAKCVQILAKQIKEKIGSTYLFFYALGAIRTRDLSLKRGVLYLLSYKRKLTIHISDLLCIKKY